MQVQVQNLLLIRNQVLACKPHILTWIILWQCNKTQHIKRCIYLFIYFDLRVKCDILVRCTRLHLKAEPLVDQKSGSGLQTGYMHMNYCGACRLGLSWPACSASPGGLWSVFDLAWFRFYETNSCHVHEWKWITEIRDWLTAQTLHKHKVRNWEAL